MKPEIKSTYDIAALIDLLPKEQKEAILSRVFGMDIEQAAQTDSAELDNIIALMNALPPINKEEIRQNLIANR